MNFNEQCCRLLSKIPKGKISTYKDIARALNTKAYRAVGNAMAKNPTPITVPCHRVINSDGSIGGYALGIDKKVNLLKKEGISIKKGKIVDYKLIERCTVLFSPTFGEIDPQKIVQWILKESLPVRIQLQMHKQIWLPDEQGV